jgi:hypothetical protein
MGTPATRLTEGLHFAAVDHQCIAAPARVAGARRRAAGRRSRWLPLLLCRGLHGPYPGAPRGEVPTRSHTASHTQVSQEFCVKVNDMVERGGADLMQDCSKGCWAALRKAVAAACARLCTLQALLCDLAAEEVSSSRPAYVISENEPAPT